ncbi:arsenate reductase (glutaredoxin) [Pseudobacteriovorax antillogorgiicola]|uniref:Arsenate reductase n=1 Tax=Pseudobacteriovorax antillogorgiicola TaxID=1513793 RepID=A0A1Y6CDK6_9BACT|nr:arsenate reductase (glutaredoxin) [Pseudobacteriovorax antillogorgiicola]TCS48227.1 arsenate reductase [Pseudobacteriovorax antillogorgiicola]SMF57341.1 arsenate reductase [Pseudobacteriovorax antillogorgiicola]
MKLLHNPRCSKSREALSLLEERGINLEVREYLKEPMEEGELRELVKMLGTPVLRLLRQKESLVQTLELDLSDSDAVFAAIAAHPSLMERPVFIGKSGKAVIGRPPERVLDLL